MLRLGFAVLGMVLLVLLLFLCFLLYKRQKASEDDEVKLNDLKVAYTGGFINKDAI